MKCAVIEGSILSGVRNRVVFSLILNKAPGYKIYCKPETKHHKEKNKSVLNKTTFYLENDNHEEVNFNGETLTFTLQVIKI